jgi:polyhydroxyalkanoate synthesis regulator phasin
MANTSTRRIKASNFVREDDLMQAAKAIRDEVNESLESRFQALAGSRAVHEDDLMQAAKAIRDEVEEKIDMRIDELKIHCDSRFEELRGIYQEGLERISELVRDLKPTTIQIHPSEVKVVNEVNPTPVTVQNDTHNHITVPEQPVPDIHVDVKPTPVTIHNQVDVPQSTVEIQPVFNVPEQATPEVNVTLEMPNR